jgi:RimJ/RimL family protein N-acetyltransferase
MESAMFIRTERLLLRPGWVEDAPALASAIGDESILTKLAQVPSPYRVTDALWFLTQPHRPPLMPLLIFERTDGAPRLIGGTGLHDQDGEAEIGYWLARDTWGRGYATEAGRAVVSMARHSLRLSRLVSGHFVDNPASGRVLTKLGFRPTGQIVPRESKARGQAVPCKLYELDLTEGETSNFMPRAMAA